MSKGLAFWIVFLLWIVMFVLAGWQARADPAARQGMVSSVLVFILLFLLGWATFGFIVQ